MRTVEDSHTPPHSYQTAPATLRRLDQHLPLMPGGRGDVACPLYYTALLDGDACIFSKEQSQCNQMSSAVLSGQLQAGIKGPSLLPVEVGYHAENGMILRPGLSPRRLGGRCREGAAGALSTE